MPYPGEAAMILSHCVDKKDQWQAEISIGTLGPIKASKHNEVPKGKHKLRYIRENKNGKIYS